MVVGLTSSYSQSMRFIVTIILLTPFIVSGQHKLDSVLTSKETCEGTTAGVANCIQSLSFEEDNFITVEDIKILNSILNDSKYKKHFQAKIGPVNCAEFVFGQTRLKIALVCYSESCKVIDLSNMKEWRIKDTDNQMKLKSIIEKYWS